MGYHLAVLLVRSHEPSLLGTQTNGTKLGLRPPYMGYQNTNGPGWSSSKTAAGSVSQIYYKDVLYPLEVNHGLLENPPFSSRISPLHIDPPFLKEFPASNV